MAALPKAGAGTGARAPQKLPIGVRTPPAKRISWFMSIVHDLHNAR